MSARRSKPTLAARLRRYWIVGGLVLVVLALLGRLAAGAPQLRLHRLEVAGNGRVPSAEIEARAGIDPQGNLWLVNAHAVEARVAAIPFIKTVRLERSLPADARIVVTERAPDGCVRDAVATASIDSERRVLEMGCAAPCSYVIASHDRMLPGTTMNDPDLIRLQADGHALAADGRRMASLNLDRFGQLEGRLGDGIRVRFGDDGDLDAKERLIGPILAALGPRATTVRAIDLRAPGTPVVERGSALHRRVGFSTPN